VQGCDCVKTHNLKIIGKKSMTDYANEALAGVSVVTAKYASV